MLELLLIGCYGVIGFGIGGITFKNYHKKAINAEYEKLKKEAENEINQHKANKQKHESKNLELIKEKSEMQKLYNRSERNVTLLQAELLQMQLLLEQQMLEKKTTVLEKSESKIDSYFNN